MRKDAENAHEIRSYRTMAGELICLVCGSLPQAAYVGSLMQKKIIRLKVAHMIDSNQILNEIGNLRPLITFRHPIGKIAEAEVVSFSDASFNISPNQIYGQTGIITGLRYRAADDATIYHIIDWSSAKQKRESYSSYGAEITACTEADDRGLYLKSTLKSISPADKFTHILIVDYKGMLETITKLHERKEYRLRQTVQRLGDSFEAKEMTFFAGYKETLALPTR